VNDAFEADGMQFRIEKMDGLRIDRIGIRKAQTKA
jgi:CBS domain containing-hemolysin-like protein